ncbi:ATP-grasp domain-containing protein [Microbacterium sp. SLBN-146]|uniref:ATP-grasp domain-containing protein n=1 Tax=Microbacterium sp. SLBN-146 TaxID=2768457 RepID=UPI001C930813|nr:ATP-grasp domain-containing protein [Microbacterium sp. SLBN-146]
MLHHVWDARISAIIGPSAARIFRSMEELEDVIVLSDEANEARYLDVARRLHREDPFTAVISPLDPLTHAAATLAQEWGLTTAPTPESVRRTLDKSVFRTTLRDAGLQRVPAAVVDGPDDIRRFGDAHGWPVVVKPLSGAGSTGVTRRCGRSDVDDAWRRAATRTADTPTGAVMVEQFIAGDVLVVDTFSVHGEHIVTATGCEVMAMDPPVIVCSGMPAPLPMERMHEAIAKVEAMLTVVGHRIGPAHTELLVSAEGMEILECQLRLGGEFPELTALSGGPDTYDLWALALIGADPRPVLAESPAWSDPSRRGAAILYGGGDRHARLRSVEGLAEAGARRGVVHADAAATSRRVMRPIQDTDDRQVAIMAEGPSYAEAVRNAARGMRDVALRSDGVAVHLSADSATAVKGVSR